MYKISFFDGFGVDFSYDEMETIIKALSFLKVSYDDLSDKAAVADLIKKLDSVSSWEVYKNATCD